MVLLMGCGFSNVSSATVDSKDSDFQTSASSFTSNRAKVSKDESAFEKLCKGLISIFKMQNKEDEEDNLHVACHESLTIIIFL